MVNKPQFKCPVCGKPLSQNEYYTALGLWKEKQEHIKHLEAEQRKLREQAKKNQEKVNAERKRLREKEKAFKAEQVKLRAQTKKTLAEQARKAQRLIEKERTLTEKKLKEQHIQLEKSLQKGMQEKINTGIEKGVEQQKAQLRKQEAELRKTNNKMAQLKKSLDLSTEKFQRANTEIANVFVNRKRAHFNIENGPTWGLCD
jgi:hypothetical protein